MSRGAMGFCNHCRKLMYPDRKSARQTAKLHASHKNAYPCPVNDLFWHVGELPRVVIEGHVDRDTYYQEEVS